MLIYFYQILKSWSLDAHGPGYIIIYAKLFGYAGDPPRDPYGR